mgnify:CR=1 FL=1|jgi:hypothetical protein|tara:strand:- start:24936 stop:25526 length:591 start_codon:yes stop_codon:yes gene_type:complete
MKIKTYASNWYITANKEYEVTEEMTGLWRIIDDAGRPIHIGKDYSSHTNSVWEVVSQIAPHEGRELDLVLAGTKPMGLIEKAKDPEQYQRLYDIADLKRLRFMLVEEGTVVFALLPNRGLLVDYYNLVNGKTVVKDNKEYQTLMGRLFGYTEEEITAFINADIQCNCSNCQGVQGKAPVIKASARALSPAFAVGGV